MKRAAHKLANRVADPILQLSGTGAILAGVLFVMWGYLDKPHMPVYLETVVDSLSLIVPALFLTGLMGLWARCEECTGRFGETGITVGFIGSGLGILAGLANLASWYEYEQWLALYWYVLWLPTSLVGLTLVGIATTRLRRLSGLGVLPLSMGVFGWGYYFTDSGAVFEAPPVHIMFGALFSLCWVALGLGLRAGGVQQAAEPPA